MKGHREVDRCLAGAPRGLDEGSLDSPPNSAPVVSRSNDGLLGHDGRACSNCAERLDALRAALLRRAASRTLA
jgi:hypothetical protein